MIEHNRKDNCIKFLPICTDDSVYMVDDTVLELENNEKVLKQKDKSYDYLIYKISNTVIDGRKRLEEKLKQALTLMGGRGTLVLLMENPYALHMFAGEVGEKGELFGTLSKKPKEVVNISYPMLKETVGAVCSGKEVKWFYPYPTLEFPVAVYSDEYLPKSGECTENFYNFDYARLELFKEEEAFDEIIKSGLFAYFANCYMVVIGEAAKEGIKYSRYSNERVDGLRIRTDIYEDFVRKRAYDNASVAHIHKLSKMEQKLNQQLTSLKLYGKKVEANRILKKEEGSVSFEFVQGISLLQRLDELLVQGENKKAKEFLKELCEELFKQPDLKEFVLTKEFEEIFGELSEEMVKKLRTNNSPLLAAKVTDIDMICQNILIGDKVTVIDYEWSFEFPIPVQYLVYRILFFFLEFKDRKRYFGSEDLYEEFGITNEQKEVFATMEKGFQKYVQGGVKLLSDSFYEKGKPILQKELLQKELNKLSQSQICIRLITEKGTKEVYRECQKGADGIVSFAIDFEPGEVKEAVLLPKTDKGLMRICLLQENEEGSKELHFRANGISLNPILYLFDEQAEIITEKLSAQTHRIYVSLEVVALSDTFVVESKRGILDLKENLANRELQLQNMKNSTSWRLTKPLRKLKGNKDDE